MATIEELLNQLNLGKHIDKFHAEDIDLGVAKSMSEAEFKGAGLTIGAAKKLYEALHGMVVSSIFLTKEKVTNPLPLPLPLPLLLPLLPPPQPGLLLPLRST